MRRLSQSISERPRCCTATNLSMQKQNDFGCEARLKFMHFSTYIAFDNAIANDIAITAAVFNTAAVILIFQLSILCWFCCSRDRKSYCS